LGKARHLLWSVAWLEEFDKMILKSTYGAEKEDSGDMMKYVDGPFDTRRCFSAAEAGAGRDLTHVLHTKDFL
jgi:hypothetical protein